MNAGPGLRTLVGLLTWVVLCLACRGGGARGGTIPASSVVGVQDERTERVGQVVRETMRKAGVPGISVAVVDKGRLVWAQGFGWRDVDRGLPVDSDTQFQAGSISKPVSALGVLLLQAAGKVDLDQDVNRYLKS